MMQFPVIRNGEWIWDPEKAIPSWDRAFHFGDGLFETFRVMEDRPLFFDRHLRRVSEGLERLGISPPDEDETERILSDIQRLLQHAKLSNVRMRLTFSRKGGGAYTPYEKEANCLLELTGTSSSKFELPAKGDHIGIYEDMCKPMDVLSRFKCTNALLYVMAKRWAVQKGFDEALILSAQGKVIESASSNVFMLHGNELLTAPVEEGCVDGVMRGVLLDMARSKGWRIRERSFSPKDLLEGEELFTSNAIQGVRPVLGFQNQRYDRKKCQELVRGLNERAFS